MARMSIDDAVGRDPRITMLAELVGWSRYETVGRLVCDVWPITYDQMTHLVSERVIDAAAGRKGFAEAMVEVGLARRDRSGKVAISGAKERIKYLADKSASGREGGLKSAETRRNKTKQTSSTAGSTSQASRNPPDPVPDPSPVLVPDPSPSPVPDAEAEAEAEAAAAAAPVERVRVLMPLWPSGAFDQTNPSHRGMLAEAVWRALSDARLVIGAELGLTPLPLPPMGTGSETRGCRDLRDRIRAEGALAPMVCTHVIANLMRDARDTLSLDWLSEKGFSEGSWQRSRDSASRMNRAPPKSTGAIGAAQPRSDHPESDESVPFGAMLNR